MSDLSAIQSTRKSGKEPFHYNGKSTSDRLLGFWQWSSSELAGNALRGVLAEYLVASDLNCVSEVRQEWDAYDLKTQEGVKIEVKSAAYLQSWEQQKLSPIKFGIQASYGWDADSNKVSDELCRPSDVYVFCLLDHTDKTTLDPLNLSQWVFYILSTKVLDKCVGRQRTITLSTLMKLEPIQRSYGNLATGIVEALQRQ